MQNCSFASVLQRKNLSFGRTHRSAPTEVANSHAYPGIHGLALGRFKGDMGSLREVRGEIEIPPPPLGPSGAGRFARTIQRYAYLAQI